MQLNAFTHLVASGRNGFDLTDEQDCNVYLLDGGHEAALIDSGAGLGVDKIIENGQAAGIPLERLKYLILTHAHADHAGGAAELKERYGLSVIASVKTAERLAQGGVVADTGLERGLRAGWYPRDYQLRPCEADFTVADGFRVQVGTLSLQVFETPGHCDDHVSLLLEHEGQSYLFGGDLLFHGGEVALLSNPDCCLQDYLASIRRVGQLSIDALFPGHDLISLSRARRHFVRAIGYMENLAVPPNMR